MWTTSTIVFPKVSDRDHVVRTAGEIDQLWQDATACDVECKVDPVRRDRTNPVGHAVAVRDRPGSLWRMSLCPSGRRHRNTCVVESTICSSGPLR